MLRYLIILVSLGLFSACVEAKSIADIQEGLNLEMCRSKDHHFSMNNANCTYCAQGLHYNERSKKCEGSPNVFGKCIGEDHYHATTGECVYCANGFHFDEELRQCVETIGRE